MKRKLKRAQSVRDKEIVVRSQSVRDKDIVIRAQHVEGQRAQDPGQKTGLLIFT